MSTEIRAMKPSVAITGQAPMLAAGRRRQRGVTMIEVLVALLVLSVGLLGLAALQAVSLQAGQSAYHRTQATNLAYEVADFARVNRSAVLAACQVPLLPGWQNFSQQQLPNGQLEVNFVNCGMGEITVTVSWAEQRLEDAAGNIESVVITTRI